MTERSEDALKAMTRREARAWVRKHWADWIEQQDVPYPCPIEAAEVWSDETRRIAHRVRMRP
jgi:hypothetical protein